MQIEDIEPLINLHKGNYGSTYLRYNSRYESTLKNCEKYNLKVIEDAAEVIGQTYNGRQCGSFGDISTFSFYPNKHVTTREGGMVLTNDAQIAEKCKSMQTFVLVKKII